MRARELANLMCKLEKLTPSQRQRVAGALAETEHKAATSNLIEAGDEHPSCPHCQGKRIVKNGIVSGLQRYKCRGCKRTFNVLTNTPLAHLHLRGKWLGQAEALRDGLTLKQVEKRLGVAHATAFRWRHRFLSAPKALMAQALTGVAEADETMFLRSFKGQRGDLGRKSRHRGGKAAKRGLSREQVPVLVACDRSGETADFILDADDSAHIAPALKPLVTEDLILCTDGGTALASAAKVLGVEHHAVNLSAGIRISGPWHIQHVNAYHSRLKGWMRRFRGVATKYLDAYLGWFRTIERSPDKCLQPAPFMALAVAHGRHH